MQKQILKRTEEIKRVIPLASGQELPLSRPLIIGVLNVTPDSFSDGGQFTDPSEAVKRAAQMEKEGADIIDIGGESSRPGAEPISQQEELDRVIPIIEALRRISKIPISIDTCRAKTASQAIISGADFLNDITALTADPVMPEIVAANNIPVILMHKKGTPADMQSNPYYEDCVLEIISFFTERIAFCKENDIDKSKIILDPGIGFGKRLSDNMEIISNLHKFKKFNLPLLVGTSRKSFIDMIDPSDRPAKKRIGGSIASAVVAVSNGANLVRVHDVAETVEALKVLQAIQGSK